MRDAVRVALATLVVAALVAAPAIAQACPACAANDDLAGGTRRWIALGVFILLPFAVAGVSATVVIRMVRRARELDSQMPTSRADGAP